MTAPIIADPLPLAQALIRCASVTPADAGAIGVVAAALERLGFRIQRHRFGEVENLYARLGDSAPNFCFAGHTDVVPPGEGWSVDPFAGAVKDNLLIGRGAVDMKGAIACMIAAVETHLAAQGPPRGSISFLITGDEEGPAHDGTKPLLAAIAAAGERIDHCLVGEPTSDARVGDTVKNGRRGSLNAVIVMEGRQGHVAYPHLAANPVTPLLETLHALKSRKLDDGAPGFDPSNLEVTTIDVGNPTHNIIPARASAKLNIRLNTRHESGQLIAWIEAAAQEAAARAGVSVSVSIGSRSDAFYTEPGAFTDILRAALQETLGQAPALSTAGGTSDARFIKDYCPVAELGLSNATAHMVDEHVALAELQALTRCYAAVLKRYFA